MLATDCKKLLDILTSLDRVQQIQRVCESLSSRQKDLVAVKVSIDKADGVYLALNKREPVRGKIDGSKSLKYAVELRGALANDPESITQGRGFTNLKTAFTKLSDAMTVSCVEAWQTHRAKVEPRVDAEQIHQAQQTGHLQDAERLEQLATATKRLCASPPESETAFLELERRWQEIRDLIDKLPVPTTNPEIQAFLKAVNSREGAALELLTDQVRTWLAGNSMAKKFRVRPA